MKQSTTTYTKRVNARRAGVAAGIPKELLKITVHKNGDVVRFGWIECAAPVKVAKAMTTLAPKAKAKPVPASAQQDAQNGVKRPKTGGVCAAVWAWLDANPGATVGSAKEVAPSKGWNSNNVACEFYAWRKFNGITGRAKPS